MTTDVADDDDDRKKPDKGHGKPDKPGSQGQRWSVDLGPDLGARAKAAAAEAGEDDWKRYVATLVEQRLEDETDEFEPEPEPEPEPAPV